MLYSEQKIKILELTLIWHGVKTVLEELSVVGHHKKGVGSLRPPWEVCMHPLKHSGSGRCKGYGESDRDVVRHGVPLSMAWLPCAGQRHLN